MGKYDKDIILHNIHQMEEQLDKRLEYAFKKNAQYAKRIKELEAELALYKRALDIAVDYIDRDCPFMDLNIDISGDCHNCVETKYGNAQDCWEKYCIQEARKEAQDDD